MNEVISEPPAAPAVARPAPVPSSPPPAQPPKSRSIMIVFLVLLAGGGIYAGGAFHCVTGDRAGGFTLVKKVEWGFYDQFVNADFFASNFLRNAMERPRTAKALVDAELFRREEMLKWAAPVLDSCMRYRWGRKKELDHDCTFTECYRFGDRAYDCYRSTEHCEAGRANAAESGRAVLSPCETWP